MSEVRPPSDWRVHGGRRSLVAGDAFSFKPGRRVGDVRLARRQRFRWIGRAWLWLSGGR